MSNHEEAVDFLRLVQDADSYNRPAQLEDLRFRFGDQWPVQIQNSRQLESRPCLTINETDAYLRKIENTQRQQRPRMNPHPTGSRASMETAKVLKGLCRHIEVNSDADNAYDLAFMFALTCGVGYFRMRTDFIREDSFDQDIFIDDIENPFSVAFDPNSKKPDGSDAEKALITDVMSKDAFMKEYPSAQVSGFRESAAGDSTASWVTEHDIRLAEYFYLDRKKTDLVILSNGQKAWGDEISQHDLLVRYNLRVEHSRPSFKRIVRWCKVSAFDTLEEKTLPGRFIPVIPVYGVSVNIDGKRRKMGLVRFARDPQTMVNFWQTTMTELVAMAPKAKWLVADGQDEGHENEFAQVNVKALPVLRYKPTTVDGLQVPPPQRIEPDPVPAGALENALMATENLKRVLGVFDPQVKTDGNKSGKAITAEKMQSEETNYNFYDNLTRSIKHAARIILDWTPTTYDVQRVVRIIGDDGKPSLVTLNEKKQDQDQSGQAVEKILNDVTVAEYDVVMDTGPGYNTKLKEGFEAFTMLMQGPMGEEIAKVGADLAVRMIDAHGMEALADRLAASNPLAQVDDKSEIPPKVQMMIQQLKQQLDEAHKLLQQAGVEIKFKAGLQKQKDDAALDREKIKAGVKTHETETMRMQKQHDTETFAITAQNVAEINGLVKLLTSKTEHGNRLREMLMEFEHQTGMQDKQLAAKSAENETIQ